MKTTQTIKNRYRLVLGRILNPINDKKCEFYADGAMLLKAKGKSSDFVIFKLGNRKDLMEKQKWHQKAGVEIWDFSGQLILPSFFDIHFHWVQDECRLAGKESLMEWLKNYAWPCEERFKDKEFSKKRADAFFKYLRSVGTLGGAIYSSIHAHALEDAMKAVTGDFIMGNVLMTINSPDYLKQTPKNAIQVVRKLASKYKNRYAVTPRFAPATDPVVMKETAKLARKHKSFIQTHLSENEGEIAFVLSHYRAMKGFTDVPTYTHIYDRVGVLGPKTIMGHGIYLSDAECRLLAKTKTAIAHCPTSNAPVEERGLNSGLFDFKKMEKHKVSWALASDIGGGPYLSMFDVMKSFVEQNERAGRSQATYTKAFYRATLAGAQILKMDKFSGNLATKKWGNFIVLDSAVTAGIDASIRTCEKILSNILSPIKNRDDFDSFVQCTIYKGKIVYRKS